MLVSNTLLEEGGRKWLREQKGGGGAWGHPGTYGGWGLRVSAGSLAGEKALTTIAPPPGGVPSSSPGIPIFQHLWVPGRRRIVHLTRTEKHGVPGDHSNQGAAKENGDGVRRVGCPSVLLTPPLLTLAEPAWSPRLGRRAGGCLHPSSLLGETRLLGGRAESKEDAARKGVGPGSQGKGRGEGVALRAGWGVPSAGRSAHPPCP